MRKLKKMSFIVILVILGIYLYENGGIGPRRTLLIVNSDPYIDTTNAPEFINVKIKNKKDVQKLYRILLHAPKMSKGPINQAAMGLLIN